MSNDEHFLLGVSTQLFNKLMIITSYNMIIMGGVIQGQITRLLYSKSAVSSTISIY